MFKLEGFHTWVGMHPVKFGILWYQDAVQVILYQNVNLEYTKLLPERVINANSGYLFRMVKLDRRGGGHDTWVPMDAPSIF